MWTTYVWFLFDFSKRNSKRNECQQKNDVINYLIIPDHYRLYFRTSTHNFAGLYQFSFYPSGRNLSVRFKIFF